MEPYSKADQISEIITLLRSYLNQKYTLHALYRSSADRLQGPYRDAVVAHWQEHASDQMKIAYDIAMFLVSINEDPFLYFSVPVSLSNSFEDLALTLLEVEAVGIETLARIFSMDPDSLVYGLRITLENHMMTDRHHVEDLVRMTSNGIRFTGQRFTGQRFIADPRK